MILRRALISVHDKTNLLSLAQFLKTREIEIVSTGGTSAFLESHGIPFIPLSQVTGFPEILDGRVKTLHPHIYGAILACLENPSHAHTLNQFQITPIDLVVVNLYPFEQTQTIENIDIGGPCLIRAAAKNHARVSVLCAPEDYAPFMARVLEHEEVDLAYRQQLAAKAFSKTSAYDKTISLKLSPIDTELRYGENPHQSAKIYANPNDAIQLASAKPLQGKALSYNNLLDADAALFALRCLTDNHPKQHACVIVKHATPCGAALSDTVHTAYQKAFAGDPLSAFGGIVALSDSVDEFTASALVSTFFEVILAPDFSPKARLILNEKKNLRLLAIPNLTSGRLSTRSLRSIQGGVLEQDSDDTRVDLSIARIVTERVPTQEEWQALHLATCLSIPCRSNAIVLVKNNQLVGVGAGQTSRIDAVKQAIQKACELGHSTQGAVLGSDGFFPFKDNIELIAQAGISAIAQPGGSLKDAEVIEIANQNHLAMIFTSKRHFRH